MINCARHGTRSLHLLRSSRAVGRLQRMISHLSTPVAPSAAAAQPLSHFSTAPSQQSHTVPLKIHTMPAHGGLLNEHWVLISACSPDSMVRPPVDVCLVVDVSGSMGSSAVIKTDAQAAGDESHGLSVLDVVKHMMRTVTQMLGEQDRLSIVSFTNDAKTLLQLVPTTAQGKQQAADTIDALVPLGSTNLWDGLQQGLLLLHAGGQADRLPALMLLTDGCPNVIPPRGHEYMLNKFIETHGRLASTSMFGFGYDVDSRLLSNLASIGEGQYSFIPDASFVGTTFVHALSNTLSTLRAPCALSLETDKGAKLLEVVGGGSMQATSWGGIVPLHSIQCGQTRDVVLRVLLPPGSSLRASVSDNNNSSGTVQANATTVNAIANAPTVTANAIPNAPTDHKAVSGSVDALTIEYQRLRCMLVHALRKSLDLLDPPSASSYQRGGPINMASFKQAWEMREELVREIEATLDSYKHVRQAPIYEALGSLLADVQGQYQEAISKSDWWTQWGRHYFRSLLWAHERQQCNNFKDPGVQKYGGTLFSVLRDEADRVFMTIPPPTPSRAVGQEYKSGGISMSMFNSRSNPCFHGDARVRMADGRLVPIRDLKRGDIIKVPGSSQEVDTVRCLVRTACAGGVAQLVTLPNGGPRVTSWHPVRQRASPSEGGGGSKWVFPADLAPAQEVECDAVFSFVLEGEGGNGTTPALEIEGWECLAWAHNVVDDPVAQHPFFGGNLVISALSSLPGWDDGFVELAGCVRDQQTGLVTGFLPLPAESVSASASAKLLRSRISCDLVYMQKLHEATGWTPGAEHVRPSPDVILQKKFVLANLERMWATPADYICFNVFGVPQIRKQAGLHVAARPAPGLTKLTPQAFPYVLPDETKHFVLWCSSPRKFWSEAAINRAIVRALDAQISGSSEFVWYENPKPTVEDAQIYHVQVFCRAPQQQRQRKACA